VLLTILYAFLIRPERVFINRGNHEDISLNTSANFRPNFMSSFTKYGKYSSYLFSAAVDMFCYMPLATIVKNEVKDTRYFVVHGGLSDDIDLNYLQNHVERFKFRKLSVNADALKNRDVKMVSDMLWSDPITETGMFKFKFLKKNAGCYFNERRNIGCLFGVDVTDKFCRKNSFAAIIRSHEVRENGFSEDHAKCLTIFSASFYCGGQNYGAIFKLGLFTFHDEYSIIHI
jgi:serine/threonine-protein phosphatase 5